MPSRCFFVEKISPGQGRGGTPTVFASMMFHGQALRPTAELPRQALQYGAQTFPRLRIDRNVSHPGELIAPLGAWIVSERVKVELAAILRRVSFVEVAWGKLSAFRYGLAEQPFSYPAEEGGVYEKLENDSTLAEKVGRWFEVLVPNYRQVNERWKGGRTSYSAPSVNRSKPLEIALSVDLVESEGMFTYFGHWLSSSVMDAVGNAINENFFRVKEMVLR